MDVSRVLLALVLVPLVSCDQFIFAPTPPEVRPYCQVDQDCFPPAGSWTLNRLNRTLQGSIRRTTPVARVCYDGQLHDRRACEALPKELSDPLFRRSNEATLQFTNWELLPNGTGCPLPSPSSSSPPNATLCQHGGVAPLVVDLGLVGPSNKTWWGRPGKERHENVAHVVAETVKFAKSKHARLRIRNTGHDYLGRSSAPGSLTLLTPTLNHTLFHSNFIPSCPPSPRAPPAPIIAVEAGAGLINRDLYAAGETYGVGLAGGASATVGVAGGAALGGGHGPLGRVFGMISDNVVQFEIVTADGHLRNASLCENADLFWALRGGGGGTFGVVLRAWFRAHPKLAGVAGLFGTVTATNATSWASVVETLVDLLPDLDRAGIAGYAETIYPTIHLAYLQPFLNGTPSDSTVERAFGPLRDLAGSSKGTVTVSVSTVVEASWYTFWSGPVQKAFGALDATGMNLLLGSRLVPKSLVSDPARRRRLSGFISSLKSPSIIHLVAGGAVGEIEARSSAVHPAWRSALLHIDLPATWPALTSPSSYARDLNSTRAYVHSITRELDHVVASSSSDEPEAGAAYVNEGDVEEERWQDVFWGSEHYTVLERVKRKWDPEAVFSCRKCVGSETNGF